jgi:hypothetical protein
VNGRVGRCEQNGACSLPDDGCASGYRYDRTAPSSVRNTCAEPADGGPDLGVPDLADFGGGTIYYSASFQDGTIPSSLFAERLTSDELTVVPAPWDQAHKALKMIIRPGEKNGNIGTSTQISRAVPHLMLHVTYRFETAFYFPSTTQFGAAEGGKTLQVLLQIVADPVVGNTMRFYVRNGELIVEVNNSTGGLQNVGGKQYSFGPVPKGRRVPLEFVFDGSADTAEGITRVTVDGQVLVDYKGPSVFDGGVSGGYWQVGLNDYASNIITSEVQMYLDDFFIYQL